MDARPLEGTGMTSVLALVLLTLAGPAVASADPVATVRSEGVSLDLWLTGAPRVTLQAGVVEGESGGALEVTRPRLDVGDDLTLSGDAGTVEVESGDVTAEGEVSAVLRASDPLEIRAERFSIDLKGGNGLFTGAVVVTQGTLVLLCGQLEVTYDPDSQEVRSVVATESVEIRQGDRLARGGRAEFDRATGLVELTDGPYLVQGNVRLRGTRIQFDVEGGEIACSGCQAVFSGM